VLQSAFRLFAAYIFSVIAALLIGIPMGRNEKFEKIMYPLIDILQSVPILGFFPLIIYAFVQTLPLSVGLQLASIFLIFTSQAWNLILGVYASVKFIPSYILDVADVYRFNLLTRITKIYIPAAVPAIAKNSIISWAGGLFFLISSEIIVMGSTNYMLEGIGTYVQLGLDSGNLWQVAIGIISVLVLSMVTYIFIWNPFYVIALPTGLGGEFVPKIDMPFKKAWGFLAWSLGAFSDFLIKTAGRSYKSKKATKKGGKAAAISILSILLLIAAVIIAGKVPKLGVNINRERLLPLSIQALEGISFSLVRVAAVLIGGFFVAVFVSYLLYERKALYRKLFVLSGELLSSIPASLWWPIFIVLLERGFPAVLVSLLIIFQGAIWYIFFNIALTGVGPVEHNLMEMAKIYRIKGRYKFLNIYVPMLTPYVLSGMSSAWGGAWNATIVAEYANLGSQLITFFGIGYLISNATVTGDSEALAVYIITLTAFIVVLNRTLWAWLYSYSRKKYHLIE